MAVVLCIEIVQGDIQFLMTVATEILLVLWGVFVAPFDDSPRKGNGRVIFLPVLLFLWLYLDFGKETDSKSEGD